MSLIILVRCCACLCAAVVLAGCINLPRTTEPERIFPAPSAQAPIVDLPKGTDGKACSEGSTTVLQAAQPSELVQFAAIMQCAYLSQSGQEMTRRVWMTRFVDKGVALSNQTCELFFDELERRRIETSYAQTNFNITGTSVSAILALSQHHTRAIFNIATALTAGNAWFENYKSNYVLTPQLRKLHDLIQTQLRDPIGNQIKARNLANGYTSFDDAKHDLMRYDALCSHKVIQDVINEAVAKAKMDGFSPGVSASVQEQVNMLIKDIYSQASKNAPGTFAQGEFEALYVLATSSVADRMVAAKAYAKDASVTMYITELGFDGKKSPDTNVLTKFRYIGDLLGMDTKPTILALRTRLAKFVADATPTVPDTTGVAKAARLKRLELNMETRKSFALPQAEAATSIRRAPLTSGAVDFSWSIKEAK